MGTQWRKRQTGEANTNCPVPVFLDAGTQMQESLGAGVCVWQPATKVGHMDPCLLEFTCLCGPLSCTGPGLVSVWPTDYGRCDDTTLLRLDYKRHCGFHLDHSFSLLDHSLWGKPAAMSRNSMERPMYRRTKACPKPHKWTWNRILQPKLSLQMTKVPAHSLTITWETLSQNYPTKLLPHSCPLETAWDKISVCGFKLLNFRVICYTATDN